MHIISDLFISEQETIGKACELSSNEFNTFAQRKRSRDDLSKTNFFERDFGDNSKHNKSQVQEIKRNKVTFALTVGFAYHL